MLVWNAVTQIEYVYTTFVYAVALEAIGEPLSRSVDGTVLIVLGYVRDPPSLELTMALLGATVDRVGSSQYELTTIYILQRGCLVSELLIYVCRSSRHSLGIRP
jgi:hypothetical protein